MNSEKLLITYLMAVRNGENYLNESLESLIDIADDDTEILVIDDGSCDETPRIIASYGKVIRSLRVDDTPQGPSTARNTGLRNARGQWIAILDADDHAMADRTKMIREAITANPEVDVWYGGAVYMDALGNTCANEMGSSQYIPPEFSVVRILEGNFIVHGSVCFSRKLVDQGLSYPQFPLMEDWAFYLNAAFAGAQFGRIAHPLCRYRIHSESISKRYETFRIMGRLAWLRLSNITRWHGMAWRERISLGVRLLLVALRRLFSDRETPKR